MIHLENIEAIEKRLWTAADTLRANSNYASNEYFLPVMGLIFLRHAYSRYLSVKDSIVANLPMRGGKARLLYREWFIHLRFPGHEHVKIIDCVPEGWEKSIIGRKSSFISRGIIPHYDDEAVGIVMNQKCIRDKKLTLDFARRQSKEVPPNKLVRFGDVLINSTGQGTLGRVAQFLDEIENCTVDSHVTISRPDENVPIFLYGRLLG